MKKLKSLLGNRSSKGSGKAKAEFPWIPLDHEEMLKTLLVSNKTRPQVIFKHSTSCGLSGMMLRRFQQHWEPSPNVADFYLLDLIGNRQLSNLVAANLDVPHQSPQVIVLGAEGVLAHASHGNIDKIRPESL